jgi:NhaP-type Na+/H+ or K+/H+ antiporter
VIAVAVFGLYGAATSKWEILSKVDDRSFDAFWDTLCFVVNAIIFFFSGMSCVNFAIRSVHKNRVILVLAPDSVP